MALGAGLRATLGFIGATRLWISRCRHEKAGGNWVGNRDHVSAEQASEGVECLGIRARGRARQALGCLAPWRRNQEGEGGFCGGCGGLGVPSPTPAPAPVRTVIYAISMS